MKKKDVLLTGTLIALGITVVGVSLYKGMDKAPFTLEKSALLCVESLPRLISDRSVKKMEFLDPKQLKDNIQALIVVLGNRPLDGTRPTVNMVYRVFKGIELYRKYSDSILIMSGGPTAGELSEAEMMGLIAWSKGVNPSRIILEDKSMDTIQNARFTSDIVKGKNIGQKFIIANEPNLTRAIGIFEDHTEFKDVQGIDCEVPQGLIIKQMEKYLTRHNDAGVRRRLESHKSTISSRRIVSSSLINKN